MPDSSIRRRIASEAIGLWTRVLLAVVVAGSGLCVWKMWRREDARQRTAALAAQHEPVQQLRNDLGLLRARINSVETGSALELAIADAPSVLSVLSVVCDAADAFRGDAYLQTIDYETNASDMLSGAPPTIAASGVARDPLAIRRFVDALEAFGCFSRVELGDTEARLQEGTATTAFEVECQL